MTRLGTFGRRPAPCAQQQDPAAPFGARRANKVRNVSGNHEQARVEVQAADAGDGGERGCGAECAAFRDPRGRRRSVHPPCQQLGRAVFPEQRPAPAEGAAGRAVAGRQPAVLADPPGAGDQQHRRRVPHHPVQPARRPSRGQRPGGAGAGAAGRGRDLLPGALGRGQDRPSAHPSRRRPLDERHGGDAGARGEEPARRHSRRGAAPGAGRPRRGSAADQADPRGDRPGLRHRRPHGGVLRERPAGALGGQHPRGAGPGAGLGGEQLRPARALRRALRPVAAAGVRQPGPAHPGVPEPGEERRRGGAGGRRRSDDHHAPTGTAFASPLPAASRGSNCRS